MMIWKQTMKTKQKIQETKKDVIITLRVMKNMVEQESFYGAGSFIEELTEGLNILKELSK